MDPSIRKEADESIANTVRKLWQYRVSRQVLVYVSTPIEVDTHRIICQALADGKRVAVPRCVPDTRQMEFYYIRSMDDLAPGSFGVLEPEPNPENLVTDTTASLCLIPAFSYDFTGFRLGYGKGYYDRFLANYGGHMIGICYSACVRRYLPHGRFDRPVQLLVTEKYIRRTGIRKGGIDNDR
ncbi:MAG: 5-formyltetrahydrofolate cyclo-ligase, partial [Clostridia bacterium]|nr:5-formyltetrahydrofolate cyclo-ligase [Clostridia bacterium]